VTGRRYSTDMLRMAVAAILTVALSASGAFAFACIQTSRGQCIHWAQHAATLHSFLGNAWDQYALSAAGDWSAVGADFHFDASVGGQFFDPCGVPGPDHVCSNTGPINDNPVILRSTFCGQGFGDIIELTNDCWDINTAAIYNAPVFVNNTLQLGAYDGPLQFANGQVIYDIRRVLLHEFGHVLGLDHPDAHGQNVVAIMNSRVSNLDRLQPDDINGIFSLYGGGPPVTTSGGGPAPTSGCQIDAHPAAPTGRRLLMPLCLAVLLLGRRASRRRITAREIRPWQ
jgi:hypothetical protein